MATTPADVKPEPYAGFSSYERELLQRGCSCGTSTDISGTLSRGTGTLDDNGFWQRPCNHTLPKI